MLFRATAILIMLIANSAPYVLQKHHAPMLRLFCSLAAPLFIFLSGYSFFISLRGKNEFRKKLNGAFFLLITAILIDTVVWGIVPFQTFDVLYVIAFGIILNLLLRKLSWKIKLLIPLAFVFCGHFLRMWLGYQFSVNEIRIAEIFSNIAGVFKWKSFLVDGWFPLFPWLALSILGAIVGEIEHHLIRYWKLALPLFILSFFSSVYYLLYKRPLPPEREGYLELFYPATLSVMCMAISFSIGCILLFSKIFSPASSSVILSTVSLPGRHSLLVYFLHGIVIHYLFELFFDEYNMLKFSLLMLVFFIFFYLLLYLRETKKVNHFIHLFPLPIKKILGL